MTAETYLSATRSDRGFMHMPPLHDTSGRKVALGESSAAEGPHVWLAIRSYDGDGDTHAHLDADTAWALHDQLEWLLKHHYQGDARPRMAQLLDSDAAPGSGVVRHD